MVMLMSCFFCSKKYPAGNPNLIVPEPFAFFHTIPDNGVCISIDCRKYGNAARFVRRSCKPNSEIRHITVGKGNVHVYVVTTRVVEDGEELTISHEYKTIGDSYTGSVLPTYQVANPPLPCACADVSSCEIARIKGELLSPAGVDSPSNPIPSSLISEIKKKNGISVNNLPVSAPPVTSTEPKERRRRASSRRTSSVDITEPVFVDTKETVASPVAPVTPKEEPSVSTDLHPAEVKAERKPSVSKESENLPPPASTPTPPPPSKPVKERSSKVRQSLGSSGDESYQPSQRRPRGESTPAASTRQRNRSGSSTTVASESSTPTQAASSSSTPSSSSKTDEQKTLVSEKYIKKINN